MAFMPSPRAFASRPDSVLELYVDTQRRDPRARDL